MRRDVVVADVHGCLAELDELLRLVSYRPGHDRLVFAGDLVDRGPDSAGVVRRVRELGAPCVLGNHDEWYVRCARHEKREWEDGNFRNPLRGRSEKKWEVFGQLRADDLAWLAGLPLYYRLDERTAVVHAGLSPGISLEHQEPNTLLRMRYLRRSTGRMMSVGGGELLTPDVAAFWTEVWGGPEDVVYGHHPSRAGAVATEQGGVRTWGIDTGCCFGNRLSAWIRTDASVEIASVPSRGDYAEWRESVSEK